MEIMGQLFKSAEKYLNKGNADSVFVEIGSDRWEGSTEYFANLAIDNNTVLHTVDIDKSISARLGSLPGTIWHHEVGSTWASKIFPIINKPINCLYLDNFDYNWAVNEFSSMILDQQNQYKEKFNIDMNNQTCQVEHLQQMIALYPYMIKDGIVICDDTYQYNDCWIGKCGAVVIFLLANGYQILEAADHGVILKKIMP
jgi:hypothetical protein